MFDEEDRVRDAVDPSEMIQTRMAVLPRSVAKGVGALLAVPTQVRATEFSSGRGSEAEPSC